ncbi:FixH family protein [Sphingosinicella sp. BN140058]|uniref:FixH family protein n=1 Tax=Sphingosinicella sp. BN140058 TaxID=1892855 RepID=UPI0010108A48|nr:FixH family protein [Sphingosinicella sp. BN140058]QAY78729.1 hypothetical protein ETR14_20925 [Sphingosinicella sp. BN140058]
MQRPFTGWHMTGILIAFFGVVIAVNLTMATFATRTFGGKVVENSYVASQNFNLWLKEARAQKALGWSHSIALDARRVLTVSISAAGAPLAGATLRGVARHPLGREAEVTLRFVSAGPGRYESDRPLPAGRWYLHLQAVHGRDEADFIESVQ